MIIAPVLARDPIPYLHFRSRTELAHSKICLTYSDKAIGHSRIQQSWIFKEGKRDVLPVSEFVALVCFSASVAMIFADDADSVYPPRFE